MSLNEILDPVLNEAIASKDTSKDALINYITSQFYKAANEPGNDRRMLLLVAAISLLSSSNSNVSIAAARKLAQMNVRKR